MPLSQPAIEQCFGEFGRQDIASHDQYDHGQQGRGEWRETKYPLCCIQPRRLDHDIICLASEYSSSSILAGGNRCGRVHHGITLVGDEGVIACAGWAGAPRLFPLEKREEYEKLAPTLPRSNGHLRDWLDACKGGPAASANFQYGAAITEVVLLGNVALRTGVMVEWDAANMKATNAPEADAFLKEEYRPGWDIG